MRPAVLLLLLPALAVAAPVPKAKAPEIDIRDPDGNVLLAARDLASYDWETHTMTLKEGSREPFLKALKEARRFEVCVDGKPAMKGAAVFNPVNKAHYEPVIWIPDDTSGGEVRVSIEKGFAGPGAHKETRDVKELKAALEKAGKLKADK